MDWEALWNKIMKLTRKKETRYYLSHSVQTAYTRYRFIDDLQIRTVVLSLFLGLASVIEPLGEIRPVIAVFLEMALIVSLFKSTQEEMTFKSNKLRLSILDVITIVISFFAVPILQALFPELDLYRALFYLIFVTILAITYMPSITVYRSKVKKANSLYSTNLKVLEVRDQTNQRINTDTQIPYINSATNMLEIYEINNLKSPVKEISLHAPIYIDGTELNIHNYTTFIS